jgi:hypothetical protein
MSDALKDFCRASRELDSLQEATRTQTRELGVAKTSATTVLRDSLIAQGDAGLLGYLAQCDGKAYRVRLRPIKPAPPKISSGSMDEILKLWDAPLEIERRLGEELALDQVACIVTLVLQALSTQCETKFRVDVRPHTCKEEENSLLAPPETLHVEELVHTLIHSREKSAVISKEAKECRSQIIERRDTAAEVVLPQLQALPSERKVQKLNLRDAAGATEAFYIRIKPPRKQALKKVSAAVCKKILKVTIENTLARFAMDTFEAPAGVARREFGEELCNSLREAFLEQEAQCAPELGETRISLDRVRK